MISSISIYNNLNYYKQEYDKFSDEELICLIKECNEQAERCLFKRYSFIVKRIASSFFIIGGSIDDLFQEAMIGLINAMNSYDGGNGSSFRTYAEICIRRQIISAIRKTKSYEMIIRNTSFYDFSNEVEEIILADEYTDLNSNPENVLIHEEEKNQYSSITSEILSNFEKMVLAEYGKGKSYEEISAALNRNVKSIDNALHRAKKKIICNRKKLLKDM